MIANLPSTPAQRVSVFGFGSGFGRVLLPALAVVATLGAFGCKPKYPECKKDKHCKVDEGEKCVEGMCSNCTTNDDCVGKGPGGTDWVCFEMRCTDPAQAGVGGGGGLGSPCQATTECGMGYVCRGGKCDVCMDNLECLDGGTCNFETGTCSGGGGGGGGQCQTDDQCAIDEICDMGMCVFSGGYGSGETLCNLEAVYFGFDSPTLSTEAQQALQAAAECIKTQNRLVYLEAHADARGTEEYNILLTDRRGQGVKSYLAELGVPPTNMQVISKGSLEASGTDESSWQKDRRVQFIWP